MSTRIVTFDAGQTLVELDLDFLAARLGERGVHLAPEALQGATGPAWRRYDALVDEGRLPHTALWRDLFQTLLAGAGATGDVAGIVEWLWEQQQVKNLFRRPIPDMVALARELAGAGVRVAVLSNSEGRLAALLEEIGIADAFVAIIDSGRVGLEKPDPRIFENALAVAGGTREHAVHIGDSWPTDVAGALAAGWRAVWYGRRATTVDDPRVAVAHDADGVRAALAAFAIV